MSEYRVEDLPPLIAAKIRVNPDSGCWEWQGYRMPKGYGQYAQWDRAARKVRSHKTHRLVYELLVGPIPDGLTIDHVKARGCISNACCWPAHLEPVSRQVNNSRGRSPSAVNAGKTSCDSGHELDLLNTRLRPAGGRDCRACARDREQGREPRRR